MAFDINSKPWYFAFGGGVAIIILVLFAANMLLYKDIKKESSRLDRKIVELEREVEKGRAAKADLPNLEDEIRNKEEQLALLRQILPTRKETDLLLKKLRQLTERGSFELIRFKPGEFEDKDFFTEWPITVELDGTYHELGLFFDRLSHFSRPINVADLTVRNIRGPKDGGRGFTVHAKFTQRTFIYKETEDLGGG